MARSWSYSGLTDYEKCPLLFKLRRIDRLPEPPSPALERGKATHTKAEQYLLSEVDVPLPSEFYAFDWLLTAIKDQRTGYSVEEKWGFDSSWVYADWREAWLRVVADVIVYYDDQTAEIIDWKTGREYDSHADQGRLYGLTTLCKYPETSEVNVRFVYTDSGAQRTWTVRRHDVERMQEYWTKRATPLLEATEFPPTPGDHCKWCAFSKRKGGPCPVA